MAEDVSREARYAAAEALKDAGDLAAAVAAVSEARQHAPCASGLLPQRYSIGTNLRNTRQLWTEAARLAGTSPSPTVL
jgi:hypothetical protein